MGSLDLVFTLKFGSWLNMVEIEISTMVGQCLNRRIPTARFCRARSMFGGAKEMANACAPIGVLLPPMPESSRNPSTRQHRCDALLNV